MPGFCFNWTGQRKHGQFTLVDWGSSHIMCVPQWGWICSGGGKLKCFNPIHPEIICKTQDFARSRMLALCPSMPDLELTLSLCKKWKRRGTGAGEKGAVLWLETGNTEWREGKSCFPSYIHSLEISNGNFISCRFRTTAVNRPEISMGCSRETNNNSQHFPLSLPHNQAEVGRCS